MNYKTSIYQAVQQIPKGKVSTYGKISEYLKTQNAKVKTTTQKSKLNITPRMVGMVLHNNPDPKNIPCHRVVNVEGRLAKNYVFGGWQAQKRKLLKEGVKFRDKMHVDLRSCLHLLYCFKNGRKPSVD